MEVRELLPPDTRLAFAAMRALRPVLGEEDAFVRRVDGVQRPEGYRLVGAFDPQVDGGATAAAVAGFRLGHNLAWGRFLYVDDLSTLPAARRRGHARRLLEWLATEARGARCDTLHLDSGVGPARFDAHALYFAAGLRIDSHHFSVATRRGR